VNTPLSEAEYEKLESILSQFQNKKAMNLEEVDGFFTALICSPEMIPPSVYLQEVRGGGEMSDENAFNDIQEAKEFMGLIMRHWNAVVRRLSDDEVFSPILREDTDGNVKGNDWAKGFVRGMKQHQPDWSELLDDEENGGALVAILALAYEHDPDPEMRPYKEPVSDERREQLLAGLSAGAMQIHKYFAKRRREMVNRITERTFRRETPKIGRNQPCPCGSGRKYKRCCGNAILN